MSELKRYCIGFAFHASKVLLIKKNRPSWQLGKWNGIGGHVEDMESAQEAMLREGQEETGVSLDWKFMCYMRFKEAEVTIFRACFDGRFQSLTDETCQLFDVDEALNLDLIPDLYWLLPTAFHLPLTKCIAISGVEVLMQFIPGLNKWDNWFMKQAFLAAEMSKDTSTKVGAILVRDKRVLSTGYNGMPRGVCDTGPGRNGRPEKYFWYEHAERNAIFNAAFHGIALADATMYCFWMPCADCARAIIQTGIVEVCYYETMPDRWSESQERAIEMLTEAKVLHRKFGGNR